MKRAALVLVAMLGTSAALAQQSASYKLVEHAFNAGGRPDNGAVAASASHRISLDAIGDTVQSGWVAGGSNNLGGGFVSPYPPPTEVVNLRFTSNVSLTWNPEPSTGSYNLYRGAVSSLSGAAYGSCRTSAIGATTTNDPDVASPGQGYFYLVTAENLIAEEGIKGRASSGALRPNPSPCP